MKVKGNLLFLKIKETICLALVMMYQMITACREVEGMTAVSQRPEAGTDGTLLQGPDATRGMVQCHWKVGLEQSKMHIRNSTATT